MDVIPSSVSSSGSIFCAVWIISANGASFCQVDKIRPVNRSNPCRTSGIQKCTGASPILSARAAVNIMLARGLDRLLMLHSPVIHAFVALANKIIAAAVACVKKYFVVASTARGWWCCAISGVIASVLISRPIQARSQWELAKAKVVPSPRLDSRVASTYGFIGGGGTLTVMLGVWARKLY